MQSFTTAREIVTGVGSIRCLGQKAAALGRSLLLVTGRKAMRRSGTLDEVLALLDEAGVEAATFEEAEHDPDIEIVDAARAFLKEMKCDAVMGLGGGSAMDAAKAIAGLAFEPNPTVAYYDGEPITQRALPLIEVPTTAGTGAEVTKNAVLSHRDARTKKSIRADSMMPAVAIVDPNLTLSCPPKVTAASGTDALVQAIEAFTSRNATPLTDGLAFDAAARLIRWLEAAYDDGKSMAAREQCAYASLMAGMALANSRLGAVHGMAHPLGARYGLEHGVVCALLMPDVMRLNRDHVGDKYDRISQVAEDDIVDFFEGLVKRFGLRSALKKVTIPKEDFPAIIAESLASGSLKANAKEFTEADVQAVLDGLLA